MKLQKLIPIAMFLSVLVTVSIAKTSGDIPNGKPAATIDLASTGGVALAKAEWRYSDTRIVETDFRGPGPDKQPTGAPEKALVRSSRRPNTRPQIQKATVTPLE